MRVPPGHYVTPDYPVLSAGPTPHTPFERWDFQIVGEVDAPRRWRHPTRSVIRNEDVAL